MHAARAGSAGGQSLPTGGASQPGRHNDGCSGELVKITALNLRLSSLHAQHLADMFESRRPAV